MYLSLSSLSHSLLLFVPRIECFFLFLSCSSSSLKTFQSLLFHSSQPLSLFPFSFYFLFLSPALPFLSFTLSFSLFYLSHSLILPFTLSLSFSLSISFPTLFFVLGVRAPRDTKAEYKKKSQPFDGQPLFLSRQTEKNEKKKRGPRDFYLVKAYIFRHFLS